MKEFFAFFSRYLKWVVLVVYVAISFMLLVNSDPYRQHLWLTSASSVSGAIYGAGHNITSFFSLREVNDDLNRRNATLEAEVANLREEIERMKLRGFIDTLVIPQEVPHFEFIVANVINNSVHHPHNYITIDKGSDDGVSIEMGVVDHSGVVGTVSAVGPHFSRVISLLNPNFRLSCKIKGSDFFGSLVWNGNDPRHAMLEELPRHTVFEIGDTIVTSGYSSVFPAGLPVGRIMPDNNTHTENFFSLPIELFADFTRLSNVQVVKNHYKEELNQVEENNIVNSDPSAR